jgi:hypothetical protein
MSVALTLQQPLLLTLGIGGADLQPEMSQAAYNAARTVLVMCRNQILPIMMMITLTYTICRGYLQSGSLQFDLGPIFRLFFILILLGSYRTLVPLIGDGLGAVTAIIRAPLNGASAYQFIERMADPTPTLADPNAVVNGTLSVTQLVEQSLQQFKNAYDAITTFSLESLLTRFVTQGAIMLIRNVMYFIRMFALGFLFVAGPIAITLSAIPAFGGLAKHWLQNFISVQLWSVTFAILDLLFDGYTAAKMSGTAITQFTNPVASAQRSAEYMMACLIFIILYIMAPYLTSLIIGGSAVQGFIGSVAGMAASMAGTVAQVAAPGGGGVAGAAGRMLQTARSAAGGSGGGGGASSGGGDDSAGPAPAAAAPPPMAAPPTSNVPRMAPRLLNHPAPVSGQRALIHYP